MGFKDRRPILMVFGIFLLIIGVGAAIVGPLEMYCFYLFSEGGRFYYDGFGFGSFMFGNIASQIIGYYLIALVFVPLGYGHLRIRRWARTMSITGMGFWLVVGAPLSLAFLFILLASKEVSPAGTLIAAILVGLSYLVIPGLLIRFYQSKDVRLTFETRDPKPYRIEQIPISILVLCCLYLFYAVVLHVPIFFNGLFPLFGIFLSGLQGIFLLDISVLCLACLVWGTSRLRVWAWWGSLVYMGSLTVSALLTFSTASYADVLSHMRFAPMEVEILSGLPFQGIHFAAFIALPLLATLGLIVYSKRYFAPVNVVTRIGKNVRADEGPRHQSS
jgi:hypothetical protein